MRRKGTKYREVDILPVGAKPVSQYARENDVAPGQVYTKWQRYHVGGSKNKPDYDIVQYAGINFVVE
ncbi:MAG: hypothetical protein EBU01_08300 [Crocinitomicaceae bacterium]|nr:hypothetical protein [Crocinitomicaceae bacterium]